jgi:prepilin peptidase CpaA
MMTDLTRAETMMTLLILATAAISVVSDLRHRRVYNVVTMPAMAAGLALNALLDGPTGLLWALAGLLLAAALFLIPVALGGMGAGDLKLVAALGALGGPGYAFWCVAFTCIGGGVFAFVVLVARRRFFEVAGGMALAAYTRQPIQADSGIRLPYALPIAVGAVAALLLRSV